MWNYLSSNPTALVGVIGLILVISTCILALVQEEKIFFKHVHMHADED